MNYLLFYSLTRKKSSIKFKKQPGKKSLNNVREEAASVESNENESSEGKDSEDPLDDVFQDIDTDIHEMEVNLCQLINETFKFDEDYEL